MPEGEPELSTLEDFDNKIDPALVALRKRFDDSRYMYPTNYGPFEAASGIVGGFALMADGLRIYYTSENNEAGYRKNSIDSPASLEAKDGVEGDDSSVQGSLFDPKSLEDPSPEVSKALDKLEEVHSVAISEHKALVADAKAHYEEVPVVDGITAGLGVLGLLALTAATGTFTRMIRRHRKSRDLKQIVDLYPNENADHSLLVDTSIAAVAEVPGRSARTKTGSKIDGHRASRLVVKLQQASSSEDQKAEAA